MRSVGIGASVHFDPPVHKHPIYQEFVDGSLPVTEKVSDEILTLPMFPSLKKREITTIVEQLILWITKRKN